MYFIYDQIFPLERHITIVCNVLPVVVKFVNQVASSFDDHREHVDANDIQIVHRFSRHL